MSECSEVVICGAGIAGVSATCRLAERRGGAGIMLIDEREPLTLTSDKGTQGYRNWWPGPDDTMLRFVSRSIDLLEQLARETNNVFRLNRRGYLFVTHVEARVSGMRDTRRIQRTHARHRAAALPRAAREGDVQRYAAHCAALGAVHDLDRSNQTRLE